MTVLLRPEQIDLHPSDGEQGPSGRIVRSGYHGHDAVLQVQIGQNGAEQLLLVRTLGNARLSPGSTVKLAAQAARQPDQPRRHAPRLLLGPVLERGRDEGHWVLEGRTWGHPSPSVVHDWHLRAVAAAHRLDPTVAVPRRLKAAVASAR